MVGSGRLAEHIARKPDGGAQQKSPIPFPSVLPCAVFAPAKELSCPKLKIKPVSVESFLYKSAIGEKPTSLVNVAFVRTAELFL